MRKGSAILLLAALALPVAAQAGPDLPGPVTRECERVYGGKTFAPLIRRAWAERKWEKSNPVSDAQAKRIRNHRRCARDAKAKGNMLSMSKRQRNQFQAYREQQLLASSLTPYPGPGGTRWAIPWYIVACESGGSWSAYNPSGAAGPYQIMASWGRPFPVVSEADKLAHHRIAANLWNGGAGASNWVCA